MERILIVDDVDINRKILKYLFQSICANDVTIDEAENGKIALKKMMEKKYDIVFLDIHMPIMNGDEVIEKYREFEKKTRKYITNIIVLSGSLEDNEDYDRNFLKMVTDYMIKPITESKLIKALDMCGKLKKVRFK